MSLKKRTRFFYLMLQGKSIIPPATQAIKMWIKTFSIWHKLRTFSSRTSCAYFSVPLFLSYCHWFSEFEKKMDDGIVHTLIGALQVLESRLVGVSQISQKRNKKLLTAVYILNKSTTIFHGLHSYRSWKWRHKMFKTQVEPRAAGEWFHCNNNYFFYEKPKTKQAALRDMSRHFHGLYSHRP